MYVITANVACAPIRIVNVYNLSACLIIFLRLPILLLKLKLLLDVNIVVLNYIYSITVGNSMRATRELFLK